MWLHVRGASGQKKPIQTAHNVEHVKPFVQQWQPHRVNLTGQRQRPKILFSCHVEGMRPYFPAIGDNAHQGMTMETHVLWFSSRRGLAAKRQRNSVARLAPAKAVMSPES